MYRDVATQAPMTSIAEEPCLGSDNEWDFGNVCDICTRETSDRWHIVWDQTRRAYEFVDASLQSVGNTHAITQWEDVHSSIWRQEKA